MSVKITVTMTDSVMFDFLLRHTYSRPSGIMSAIFTVVALALGIGNCVRGDVGGGILLLIVAGLFLTMPISLLRKAKAQVKRVFALPLEYEISDAGITVRQGEREETTPWSAIMKVVGTGKSVIIYLNRMRAFVLPKESIGENYGRLREIIRAALPKEKIKIK